MAFAMPSLADNVKIGGINYRISGSTATVMPNNYDDSSGSVIVIGLNNGYEGDVVIPETITVDGVSYEVTSAFEGTFSNSTKLTSVSLPSTLTDLGSTPFSSCNKLLSINVSPDNPTYSSVDGVLYKSMEFTGEGLQYLNIDDRLCIANMAIEAGAKNGIFPVDDITREYCDGRYQGTPVEYTADEDAEYDAEYTIDLSTLRPTVAFPHLPENTKTVDEIGETEVKIDQCVIGSCTNGRISDLRAAAEIFKGKKVAKGVRCIIIPGTQKIWLQAMHEGLFDIFIEAGAVVSTPTCGPCLGGHMGILAAGERAISTTNRNFVGRMGHVDSEVYLASPAVAAASAVKGYITDPAKV